MSQAIYQRTQTVPLPELRPYPGNARRGNPALILESLCRTGQYRSIIVREEEPGRPLTVLAGNHTLQAIAAHGPGPCGVSITVDGEELPCALCGGEEWTPAARVEVVTCDDHTARRINLVDNKSAEDGTWDQAALAELIDGMDGDLTGTGWTEDDLAALARAVEEAYEEEPEAYSEEDQEQQEPAAPGSTAPAPAPAPAAPSSPAEPVAVIPAGPAPGTPAPPVADGHRTVLLTYTVDGRDEIARLVSAARETFEGEDASSIVLRALRTLVAVLDTKHAYDGAVTLEALRRAAGAGKR